MKAKKIRCFPNPVQRTVLCFAEASNPIFGLNPSALVIHCAGIKQWHCVLVDIHIPYPRLQHNLDCVLSAHNAPSFSGFSLRISAALTTAPV